jgi:hypothetical protein
MQGRIGATLVEVLVAIFVMAIGLIALLSLFPLGAFQMAQAIRDDRVASCVSNATALAVAMGLRDDTSVTNAFNNPGGATYANASPDGPSYPVYVDAVGSFSYIGNAQAWIAGNYARTIRRVTPLTYARNVAGTLQWFTLLDDINFNKDGIPSVPAGFVERNASFSWAYLLRRPRQGVPAMVEMWVVVYQQRPLALNATLTGEETAYAATTTTGTNVVTLTGNPPPPVNPGTWILDCSPVPPVRGLTAPGNCRFYRVVNVSSTTVGSVDLETDTPILAGPVSPPRQFAVLSGVAEVVYKGTNWLP